jgi:hypothetical protein
MIYARSYAHQFEAELAELKLSCNLDGWKNANKPLNQVASESAQEVIEFDAREPNVQDKLDAYFNEYCKNNPCTSPSPTPVSIQKPQPIDPDEEIGFCYVEKNGSFEMTTKECLELSNADSDYFRRKAYENCKEGKLPIPTDECTEKFYLDY